MPNFEAAEGGNVREGFFAVLSDVSAEFALQNRLEERADFFFVPGDLELHPAVLEIPYETSHVETFRHVPDGPAKAHALDIAFVKDLHRCAHASKD
jgi:hypothetical protein